MEDDIDLRKYIDVLLKHWLLIVSITLIAVLVAGLISFLPVKRTYEAKASLLFTETGTQLVLEPNFTISVPEEDQAFKQAMVALVKSSSVAAMVIESLGDVLSPGEQSSTAMLGKVKVETDGDLIEITVSSSDAEKAVAIANAWTESYESYINSLDISTQSSDQLQAQADAAYDNYEEKQEALEAFLTGNSIEELSDKIADKELLIDIKSLREQIESGALSPASAAANRLALMLLQVKAFTILPDQLQLSLEGLTGLSGTTEEQLHDIDALISILESRSETQPGKSVDELRQEILQLQVELEQDNAERKELIDVRDSTWDVYIAIHEKAIAMASESKNAVVSVVAPATVHEINATTHRVTNMAIALVLGLIVGVFAAFGVEYFKKPRVAPQPDERKKTEEEV